MAIFITVFCKKKEWQSKRFRLFLMLTALCTILSADLLTAQIFHIRDTVPDSPVENNIPTAKVDSALVSLDSLASSIPSFITNFQDSVPPGPGNFGSPPVSGVDPRVKVSENGLTEIINYSAVDSQRMDVKNQVVHLYGEARVEYESRTLTADYIIFNMKDNIATAEGMLDSMGILSGKPNFTDGEQNFSATGLKYNFKKGKGIIYDARTQQSDMYILGKRTKYVSEEINDSTTNDVIYSSNALITTCNHSEPHFGIRTKKIKVVPDKVAIVGPSNLEIAGVSTPLVIPFGFFPLSKTKQSGMLRGEFERSSQLGLGFRGWGWYIPISETLDLTVRSDIYTRGSFRVYGDMNYYRRYKYRGALNLTITSINNETGLEFLRNNSIGLRWSHSQDGKANPNQTFGGSVNLQTNNNQSQTFNDPNSRLQNIIRSNMNYTNNFPGKNYTLTAGFNHSQNTSTRDVTIDFPNADFKVQQFFPFKRKVPLAKPAWYEKISVRYEVNLKGQLRAKDTTFFTQETVDNLQVGMRHKASTNATFNLLKYIQVSPQASLTEVWNVRSLRKRLSPQLDIEVDSIQLNPGEPKIAVFDTLEFGRVIEDLENGFKPYHLFSTGVSASTKIFGTIKFKKGRLKGIRHQMNPMVSFNYVPDYTSGFLDYYRTVDTDLRPEENDPEEYGIFDQSVYSERPNNQGEQRSIRFSIGNVVEAKYYSKKDSTDKKFKLINSLNINTSYNMAKDSQKWETITFRGNTYLFDRLTTVTFGWRLDPYALDADGRRSNEFNRKVNGKLLRFVNADVGLSTTMPLRKLKELITGKKSGSTSSSRTAGAANRQQQAPPGVGAPPDGVGTAPSTFQRPVSLWEWFENFTLKHEFRAQVRRVDGRDTLIVNTHNIRTSGSIQLTEKWGLNFGLISYDLKNKAFTYPALGFSRDLHCWQLAMQWYPESGVYTFSLKVKPGSLGFINVPWGRNRFDAGQRIR